MFKPNVGGATHWVPMRRVIWSWGGKATHFTGTGWAGAEFSNPNPVIGGVVTEVEYPQMKREGKLFVRLLLVIGLGVVASGQNQSHPKRDEAAQKRFEEFQSLKLELTAERTEWKVGEQINLTLRITNPGENQVILLDAAPSLYKYEIKVTGRYNQPIAETAELKSMRAQGFASARTTGVRGKGTLEEKIKISWYFQMDKPGIYRIRVRRLMGSVSETERFFYRESNTLTISVVN